MLQYGANGVAGRLISANLPAPGRQVDNGRVVVSPTRQPRSGPSPAGGWKLTRRPAPDGRLFLARFSAAAQRSFSMLIHAYARWLR
jgi:hypothetical protein